MGLELAGGGGVDRCAWSRRRMCQWPTRAHGADVGAQCPPGSYARSSGSARRRPGSAQCTILERDKGRRVEGRQCGRGEALKSSRGHYTRQEAMKEGGSATTEEQPQKQRAESRGESSGCASSCALSGLRTTTAEVDLEVSEGRRLPARRA